MQKLDQIQKFAVLLEGEDATFMQPQGHYEQARLIKMRLNAPSAVNLYITPITLDPITGEVREHHADHQIFLAHIAAGFEQLQFMYEGSFCLNVIGGSVWLDTYDNSAFSVEASDPTSFARLFEREERHPAILEMERMARHNAEAMRVQNALDMQAAIAALELRMTSNVSSTPSASVVGTAGTAQGEPAQVPSGAVAGDPAPNPPASVAASGEPA